MEQRTGGQPSRAPQEQEAGAQLQALAQAVEGHGQVLLMSELWKPDECCTTLQNFLEQAPADQRAGPSSTRTSGHTSSSYSARRPPKRSRDSEANGADCPAAKYQRATEKPRCAGRQAADSRERRAPPAPPGPPDSAEAKAEAAAPECGAPRQPAEPDAQLLLVLCRASALGAQLPRLQLLLQQVSARHRCPPAALVGIVVQPRSDEEAEARRRMETLLCSVFAPHSPAVEVHTAVFCPSRPEGTLDIQRAAGQTHRVPLVDRETQTDGEGPQGEGLGTRAAVGAPVVGQGAYIQACPSTLQLP